MSTSRRSSLIALLGFVTAGCGGGGGSGTAQSMSGTLQTRAISSQPTTRRIRSPSISPPAARRSGRPCRPSICSTANPAFRRSSTSSRPGNDGPRRRHRQRGAARTRLCAGQSLHARRRRTSPVPGVPPGRADPFHRSNFGGDPQRRVLLGHSHGGSFVLYALFNEGPCRPPIQRLPGKRRLDRLHERDGLRLGNCLRRRQHRAAGAPAHLVRRKHGEPGPRTADPEPRATPGWRWSRSSTAVVTSA